MPNLPSAAPDQHNAHARPARWLLCAPPSLIAPKALPAGSGPAPRQGQPRDTHPLRLHPAVLRLQSEFGQPAARENTLVWLFQSFPDGRSAASLVAAPMRFEGWAEFTLTYAAGRGFASYRTAIVRSGPALDSLLVLAREAADPENLSR